MTNDCNGMALLDILASSTNSRVLEELYDKSLPESGTLAVLKKGLLALHKQRDLTHFCDGTSEEEDGDE